MVDPPLIFNHLALIIPLEVGGWNLVIPLTVGICDLVFLKYVPREVTRKGGADQRTQIYADRFMSNEICVDLRVFNLRDLREKCRRRHRVPGTGNFLLSDLHRRLASRSAELGGRHFVYSLEGGVIS